MPNLSANMIYGLYTCRLLSSVLNDTEPMPMPESMTLEGLYAFQKSQDVTQMAYMALKKLSFTDNELSEYADDYKLMTLREARFELASQQVFNALEKAEIPFIPIKGVLLKNLYPNPALRSFTDTDLYTGDRREDVNTVMIGLGYEAKEPAEYVDEYIKAPSLYFEMHHHLFGARDDFDGYFDEPFKRAITVNGKNYQMRFSDEDFFIHVFCHMYKHFAYGGCGLRQFMDVYLIKKKWTLDYEYIKGEFKKLGLYDFYETSNRLNAFLFDGAEYDDALLEISEYIFNNGTFGKIENVMANDFQDETVDSESKNVVLWKMKYFSRRWGLSYSGMKRQFPILGKLPFLLPFFYVFKLFRAVFTKGRIKSQLHDIEGMNSKQKNYVNHIMEISKAKYKE